jgi:mono/diheme cytochrome c family protein
MKKVGNHKSFSKIFFSLAFVLVTSLSAFSQDVAKGKELFNTNCAACHKLDAKATGPALRNVASKYDKEWLYKWIKNSGELIKSGDALAVKVFEENNKVPMTAFPQLSNEDIDNILAYTSEPAPAAPTPSAGTPVVGGDTAATDSGVSNNVILGVLSLVMLMLVVMLFLVNNMLTKIAGSKGLEVEQKDRSIMNLFRAYAKNQFLVLVSVVVLLLVSAYFAYGWLMQIGVDQGYEPVQPIHYSHRIHAGENGIDCKYCHNSVTKSKSAGIPSVNVCMNCHKQINGEGKPFAGEIKKIYDAAGWDVSSGAGKYTGKTKPIVWNKVHVLPDHVYFNHSQHVVVGGVDCKQCHGDMTKMKETAMVQPVEELNKIEGNIKLTRPTLTMGWCIECHGAKDVALGNGKNAYYDEIHKRLMNNDKSLYRKYLKDGKVTVSELGGWECAKCHY